jgi:hypothetical protein
MLRCLSDPSAVSPARLAGRVRRLAPATLVPLLLLAACTSPTIRNDPPSVGNYEVSIRVDPPSLQYGQKATINYAFTDKSTGKQVTNLPLMYNSTVHTVLVNHDMSYFRTGQAAGPVGGAYPVNLHFNDPDSYRLYAEFTTGYTPTQRLVYTHTVQFGLNAPSLEEPAPLVESPSPPQNTFYGVTVALDTGGPIKAGDSTTLHYTLTTAETGRPIRDLDPYNSAAGHVYILSADGEEYEHLVAGESIAGLGNAQYEPTSGGGTGSTSGNPVAPGQPNATALPGEATPTAGVTPAAGATPAARPPLGPDLTFEHKFEKPGLYKAWLQFLYHGQVVTADYVIRVQ